jgi:hypothetical protein
VTSQTAAPVVLPRVPSQLIRIALEDLEKAEKAEGIVIDMGTWHAPWLRRQLCAVCLAGSVMRSRLGVPDDVEVYPWDEEVSVNENQLCAINSLRTGSVSEAVDELRIDFPEAYAQDRGVTPYHRDRAAFFSEMRKLADDLEAAGY